MTYRDETGKFRVRRNRRGLYNGMRLWLTGVVEWAPKALDKGRKVEDILVANPGILYEDFRKLGGSINALGAAVRQDAISFGVVAQ